MKYYSSKMVPYIALLPAVLVLVGLTGFALTQALVQSLRVSAGDPWSLQAYQVVLRDAAFWRSAGFSIYIAGAATLLSFVIGLPLTKALHGYLRANKRKAFVWLPMVLPHFAAAYLVLLFFSQGGVFSSLAASAGWIEEPSDFPIMTQDRAGIGILLSYIWKEIPFVVLMMLPAFYEMNHSLKEAAATLGSGRWRRFVDIEWQQLKPVAVETVLIIFAFVLGAFEVPYLIGASTPQMAAVTAYDWFYGGDWEKRPQAMAVMVLFTILILGSALFLSAKIHSWRRRWWEGGRS